MSSDFHSLNKISVNHNVGYVYTDEISSFLVKIKKLWKKAKKEGFSNIEVSSRVDYGDENNLDNRFVEVRGDRLETDEEWHKRLEDIKYSAARELESAQRIVSLKGRYETTIKGVDKALESSPLKCEKCGVPCSSTCYMGNWKKSKRLCGKCMNEERNIMFPNKD